MTTARFRNYDRSHALCTIPHGLIDHEYAIKMFPARNSSGWALRVIFSHSFHDQVNTTLQIPRFSKVTASKLALCRNHLQLSRGQRWAPLFSSKHKDFIKGLEKHNCKSRDTIPSYGQYTSLSVCSSASQRNVGTRPCLAKGVMTRLTNSHSSMIWCCLYRPQPLD